MLSSLQNSSQFKVTAHGLGCPCCGSGNLRFGDASVTPPAAAEEDKFVQQSRPATPDSLAQQEKQLAGIADQVADIRTMHKQLGTSIEKLTQLFQKI